MAHFNSFILVLQNNSRHSTLNRVKYEKQILPPVGFESTTSCIRGKRLPTRPQGLHGRDQTTPRLSNLINLGVVPKQITGFRVQLLVISLSVVRSLP